MTPTTIAATNVSVEVSGDSVQRGFQRAAFFVLGRHWVFDIREGVIPVLVFDSSVGASGVWSGETPLFPLTDGAEFSLTLQETSPTTAFVHLAWADATGANPLNYMRGTLAAAGTIAWDGIQVVVAADIGWEYENIGICLSMGVAPLLHIVYTKVSIADQNICTPYLTLSVTVNGTWTQGAGYPVQLTAVNNASWTPLVTPYGTEIITVYAFDSGSIYSRLLSGGILAAQVDSGVLVGADAGKMSIVSRRITSGGSFYADAVFLAYQGTDWDLYCMAFEIGGGQVAEWGGPVTIHSIGNFRQANPLLTIMYYGDEDAGVADHELATLYCFWTPTTDIPTAEWVTYRLSRDQNTTWTNEAGADAAVSWIDETSSGFEVQQSGSVYAFNSEDYVSDLARSYIGIVYVIHTMPPTLRHAALGFDDPDEDLACGFFVQFQETTDLLGEFIVRHDSPSDVGAPDLLAGFDVGLATNEELKGEFVVLNADAVDFKGGFDAAALNEELPAKFIVRQPANEDLKGGFVAGQGSQNLKGGFTVNQVEDLKAIFVVRHPDSEDLLAGFMIETDEYLSKGLNVSVYRDLGVIS